MDYVESNKEFWDAHFANTSLDYPNEDVIRFLAKCKKIYENGVMLDWGCATGRHTVLGCKFGFQVYAADYVERCVKLTEEKVKRECTEFKGKVVEYIVNQDTDIEKIKDASLDVILAWGVAFYNTAEQQQEMLNNMYRMLKQGGRAFCDFRTERDSIYLNQKEKPAEEGFFVESDIASVKGCYMNILPFEKLQEMFKKSGFEVESVELSEFTEGNQTRQNSWWHVTLLKK
ncbi:MAG: methyltransferase domain-containing protein [Roseburia sp.]|nr:methyltransferase domain-containing protein [Roseburia sp.]